ncbi:hypothetical protein EC843_104134 [Buttiauxella sp. JUb87]|uniref:hypothetical protein n=1 Tax=Buttiauxella sp. JUb87 TaxID=2485129 RepID=UPI00105C01D0|nr:hypothetical protein [Buttiauxella sp. JUb87]TDN51123.1 hypothetical protein EC843_104134 [Buttiauxella sp. JUb87]
MLSPRKKRYSVSNYPDQVKPAPDSGYAAKLGIEYLLQVSSTSDITLIVSPQDYLTEERANTLYLRIGNNLSEIAAAGAEAQQLSRDHLGLGSGSTHDAQETVIDATPGRLLINGGWGLGSIAIDMTDGEILSPLGMQTALFKQGGGAPDSHFGAFGAGTHILYGSDATVVHTANMFVSSAGHLTAEWLIIDKATGAIVLRNAQNLYGPLNKPTAGELNVVSKTGDTMTGALGMEFNTTGWPGGGSTASQLTSGMAPFVSHIYSAAGNMYLPLTKAVVQTTGIGYLASSDFGVLVDGADKWPSPCITSVNDRGEVHQWIFDPNYAIGTNTTRFTSNGNILGGVFRSGNLVSHLDSLVNDIQFGAMVWQPRTTGDDSGSDQQVPSGCVQAGLATSPFDSSDTVTGIYYKPQQKFISGAWVNVVG